MIMKQLTKKLIRKIRTTWWRPWLFPANPFYDPALVRQIINEEIGYTPLEKEPESWIAAVGCVHDESFIDCRPERPVD
jgi:hypothetical protein